MYLCVDVRVFVDTCNMKIQLLEEVNNPLSLQSAPTRSSEDYSLLPTKITVHTQQPYRYILTYICNSKTTGPISRHMLPTITATAYAPLPRSAGPDKSARTSHPATIRSILRPTRSVSNTKGVELGPDDHWALRTNPHFVDCSIIDAARSPLIWEEGILVPSSMSQHTVSQRHSSTPYARGSPFHPRPYEQAGIFREIPILRVLP